MANSFFLSNNVKPLTLFSIILLVPFGIVHADHYGTVDTAVDDGDYEFSNMDYDFDKIVFDPIFEGDDRVTGYLDLRSNTQSTYRIELDIEEYDGYPDSHHTYINPFYSYAPDKDYFDIDISNLSFDTVDELRFDLKYDVNNIDGFDSDIFTNEDIPIQEPRHCTWTDMPDSLNYGTVNNGDTGTATWNPSNNSTTYNADPTTVEFTIGNWINSTGSTVVDADNTSVNGTNTDNTDTIALSSVSANSTFAFSSTLNYITIGDLIRNIGESFTQTVTVTPVCS